MNHSFFALKLIALLGCGLVAGVFFAFSTFVMPSLARLQPAQGIAAIFNWYGFSDDRIQCAAE